MPTTAIIEYCYLLRQRLVRAIFITRATSYHDAWSTTTVFPSTSMRYFTLGKIVYREFIDARVR